MFIATDWERLIMLSELVDAYWADPSPKLMAEIRLNEQLLGATVTDRRRLQWVIGAPQPVEATSSAWADPRLRLVDED